MADTSNALAVLPSSGVDTYRMSTDAATICRELVKATAKDIQGRKYVCVEGWQAIAVAHGCTASSGNVHRVDGGFQATGQVRRMDTGTVIAEAEGFVGEDEATWFGGEAEVWDKRERRKVKKMLPKRPDFAIRAMAQTRAISRACRSAFAHVVVQIDKDLGTTPAEEMMGVIEHEPNPGGHQNDALEQARRDIAEQTGNDKSTYQVEKLKKAIAADWLATNKTDKGKVDQVFDYLDMARNPDDVAAILNKNVAVIEASDRKDEINEGADRLLRWFESEAQRAHAA